MYRALNAETDRGKACVADAVLDELLKEMIRRRLIDDPEIKDVFNYGRPLGSHGTRLKIAYLLGWIGPEAYDDFKTIHSIRNKMAHSLDVDSFDHKEVRDLVDRLKGPRQTIITITKQGHDPAKVRIAKRSDVVTLASSMLMLRLWGAMDRAKRQRKGKDEPIFAGPRAMATLLADPKMPTVPL